MPTTLTPRLDRIETSLRRQGADDRPTALILGSGLGGLAAAVAVERAVAYADIDGFPVATAPGHAGRLVQGRLAGMPVTVLEGRFHPYEGWSGHDIAAVIHTLKRLGAERLIVTNAAGGLDPSYRPGDVVLIEDHINLVGGNPLAGLDDPALGPRFPDMSRAYWPAYRDIAAEVAAGLGIPLRRGIYAGVMGPSLETSAERRFLRMAGADLVGMSTVFEVIAANHCGLKVLGFSAVTNMATGGPDQQPDTIEAVLANAALSGQTLQRLLPALLPRLG